MDAYAMVAAERVAVADLLEELTDSECRTQSLCRGWTVQDVAAHVVMVLEITANEFLKTFVRSRGSFDRANERLTARWSARGVRELAQALRNEADSAFAPPGAGPEAMLADTLVHGLDISRPLAIERELPADSVRTALQFLVNLNLPPGQPGPVLVPRRLLDGLMLVADDVDFSHGAGRPVYGSGADMLLAITGRVAGANQLSGSGANTLLGRLVTARR
ncbi:MAG: maleylpyruvate isomerase family mycothiol-dependent enzyme [Jatrophihabitantaceae bacterium]